MTTLNNKSLKEFETLTGLSPAAAKQCYETYGGFGPALASFVQSVKKLSPEAFANKKTHLDNAVQINDELKQIYAAARKIKSELKCTDEEAWKKLYVAIPVEKPTAAVTNPVAEPPKPSPFTASASPAKPPVFGFGTTAPATSNPPAAAAAPSFGFGSTSSSAATSTASFGFGVKAPAAVNTTSATTSNMTVPFAFGAPKPAPKAELCEEETTVAKPVAKYGPASHFTGPFFDMPDFWKDEVDGGATLLTLDHGFLAANRAELQTRCKKWLNGTTFYNAPVKYVLMEDKDETIARVVIKDAERTFKNPVHQEKLYMFLYAMYFEFGNYGQAMSYLAGICLLVLDEQETAAILRKVAKVYIPGHWAAEAVGFATSAWVVERFMKDTFPDVAEHFMKLNFWPDTYLQKILSGLCVHVLRFAELYTFLDHFMANGFAFLIKFSLSVIEHFRKHLLSCFQINELYEIMRLDPKAVEQRDVLSILNRAPNFELGDQDLVVLRSEVYDSKVAPRLAKAPKTVLFEPCSICEKKKPVWWSDETEQAVCDDCKAATPDVTYTAY